MRIATYNVNSIRIRLDTILAWVEKYRPDVLCIQETKCQDEAFPLLVLQSSGYDVHFRGMKSYNGVAILSRATPDSVAYGFSDDEAETDAPRLMRITLGEISIVNTYVPNGYKLGSPQYDYKLRWFGRLRRYFESNLSSEKPAVWCGDMNIAPEPMDVHSPEKHLRHVCFHADAKQAYKQVLEWGFTDVFRYLYPDRQQFTFWDYLQNSVDMNKGWRIDHILATRPMLQKCHAFEVDIEPRRGPRASDHTFVFADFDN